MILGIAWLGLGLYTIFFEENLKWINYFNVVLGIIYIGHYNFDFINQYLTIENGTISKNLLYGSGKKIKLNEIISINVLKFCQEYPYKRLDCGLLEFIGPTAISRLTINLLYSSNNLLKILPKVFY